MVIDGLNECGLPWGRVCVCEDEAKGGEERWVEGSRAVFQVWSMWVVRASTEIA